MVLHEVADAHGRNHAVQHERHAADDAGRHGRDDGRELRAERERDGEAGRDADDARIEHPGQRQHTRVLAVGGVGRGAEQRREDGGQAVAQQRAMQAGFGDVVAVAGRADGRHVADMLDHRGERQRHDGDDGRDGQPCIEVRTDDRKHRLIPGERQADPRRLGHARKVHLSRDRSHEVRSDHAQEDGNDLDHALAPDVGDDDDGDGHQCDGPVRGRVRDGRAGQDEPDGDDDGPGDHGRKETHDPRGAEHFEQRRQHEVQKARARHAQAGVRQQIGLAVRRDGRIARDERERRAQERGHFALRDEMEQQRAQAREQQRRGNGQAGQRRHQDGGAEHGEHVLQPEHRHLRLAELSCVVDRFRAVLSPHRRRRFALAHVIPLVCRAFG